MPRHFVINLLLLALALPLAGQAAEPEHDWPQFMGPARSGISDEKGLLDAFPAAGAKEVWRTKGGVGMSGLAIRGERMVTMIQKAGQQKLVALHATRGTPEWEVDLAPAYKNQMGDGPRATPTIAGNQVFAFTGEGILACVSFDKGKIIWSKNVLKELKGKEADYGMASSPLVVGKQVIVHVGAPQTAVAAFDVATGDKTWTAGNGLTGYSSPTLLTIAGKEQIVAFAGSEALGLAPESGAVLWRYPYETDFGCNIALPVAYRGQLFLSAGENHGSVLLSFKEDGEKLETTAVWESQGPKSVLRNEWQTSLLLGDYLYGFDNVGGAGPVSHLTCINAATGERAWQQARFGKGNLIASDGKLWIITIEGQLVVAKASPSGYEELGRMPLLRKTRQAPAIANGLLYARDDQEIVCVGVRK